jgi:tetracycline resistance efflux pump
METFGIWGLLPPLLTIVLALITKDVVIALFLGILSGTLMIAGGNPVVALVTLSDILADSLNDGWNLRIFLFTALMGVLVGMLAKTGSAYAFGRWASKRIKTKVGALLFTWVFGLLIFIDDYFNSLTIGTVMKPLTDQNKVSRAKLAYILDSTAAPVVIMAPVSTWVVYVMSVIKDSDGFSALGMSEMAYFIRVIPFNLYAIFAVLMVLFITLTKKDFGPMIKAERRAEDGKGLFDEDKYGAVAGKVEEKYEETFLDNAKPYDMLVPIVLLVVLCFVMFPVTSWLGRGYGEDFGSFQENVAQVSVGEAFNDSDASRAMMDATIITLIISYLFFVIRKRLTIRTAGEAIVDGLKSMVPALMILVMAWGIGGLIKSSPDEGGLGLTTYLANVMVEGGFPLAMLPVVVFLISCLLSFSTGTSWGTFAIMIPLTMPIAVGLAEASGLAGDALVAATLVPVGAILGGAIFGDHSSPISDTTVLSSTGAGVPHLEHVATQVPYAVFVAICALGGHLLAGLTRSAILGLLVSAALFVAGLFILPKYWGEKAEA